MYLEWGSVQIHEFTYFHILPNSLCPNHRFLGAIKNSMGHTYTYTIQNNAFEESLCQWIRKLSNLLYVTCCCFEINTTKIQVKKILKYKNNINMYSFSLPFNFHLMFFLLISLLNFHYIIYHIYYFFLLFFSFYLSLLFISIHLKIGSNSEL